ncbi:hypothetical protein Purlil1_13527 [Purpureocillium lilacinum]|uniref:Uncharacterized protein n=1 Tax=Purpureocillium lilacinum TaxID=33203 RepID=A0ABR0BE05_PURLI|nr:hypothetical protein Purlil1_13527 [Purpureocillium lilacinum]
MLWRSCRLYGLAWSGPLLDPWLRLKTRLWHSYVVQHLATEQGWAADIGSRSHVARLQEQRPALPYKLRGGKQRKLAARSTEAHNSASGDRDTVTHWSAIWPNHSAAASVTKSEYCGGTPIAAQLLLTVFAEQRPLRHTRSKVARGQSQLSTGPEWTVLRVDGGGHGVWCVQQHNRFTPGRAAVILAWGLSLNDKTTKTEVLQQNSAPQADICVTNRNFAMNPDVASFFVFVTGSSEVALFRIGCTSADKTEVWWNRRRLHVDVETGDLRVYLLLRKSCGASHVYDLVMSLGPPEARCSWRESPAIGSAVNARRSMDRYLLSG